MNLTLTTTALTALDRLATGIWEISLPATVVIVLVLAARRLGGRWLSPQGRYALGLLIVVRLVIPVAPASSWSVFNLAPWFATPQAIPASVSNFRPQPDSGAILSIIPRTSSPLPTAHHPLPPAIRPLPTATPSPWRLGLEFLWLAGVLTLLGNLARHHFRLVRTLRRHPATPEPRLSRLLAECPSAAGLRGSLPIHLLPNLPTPALFGVFRPRLLLPAGLPAALTDAELTLVFAHELTHLRHRDVALNWLLLLLRALHWFNPAVWLACRTLRADQELACDAAVLARLAPTKHATYGHILLKLAAAFPPAGSVSAPAPFLNRTNLIQRRIHMIAQYQPARRRTLPATVALAALLGCLALTRAADPKPTGVTSPLADPTATSGAIATNLPTPPPAAHELAAMRGEMERQKNLEQILRDSAHEMNGRQVETMDQLRKMCAVEGLTFVPGKGFNAGEPDTETLRHFQSLQFDKEAAATQAAKQLEQLSGLPDRQLIEVLPISLPDSLLTQLLNEQTTVQGKLSSLRTQYGENHPEMLALGRVLRSLEEKIDTRCRSVLLAEKLRVASLQAAAESGRKQIEAARQRAAAANAAYFAVDNLQHAYDSGRQRQEEIQRRLTDLRVQMEDEAFVLKRLEASDKTPHSHP